MREGDTWRIGWQGTEIRLRHQRGLEFIESLLTRPNEEVHARNLMVTEGIEEQASRARQQAYAENLALADDGGLDVIDEQALRAYRDRLREAGSELSEAQENQDLGRTESLQHEIDALEQAIRSSAGLGTRRRKTGSDAERARVAVRKRVKASLDRIRRDLPGLHAHLAASLRTGTVCRYSPESVVVWTTS